MKRQLRVPTALAAAFALTVLAAIRLSVCVECCPAALPGVALAATSCCGDGCGTVIESGRPATLAAAAPQILAAPPGAILPVVQPFGVAANPMLFAAAVTPSPPGLHAPFSLRL
jgi:hypothetical protein